VVASRSNAVIQALLGSVGQEFELLRAKVAEGVVVDFIASTVGVLEPVKLIIEPVSLEPL